MNNFKEQLSKETSCIDNIIEKYLPEAKGHAEYIKSAMDYSVEAGGKRIRPMIMLETYKLCNGTNEEELYPFMAALEMIHTYSLVMMIFLLWIMMTIEEESLQHIRNLVKILEY